MKNILRTFNFESEYELNNHIKADVKIIDFRQNHNNHYILKLKINKLGVDNYRLILNNNHLTVFLFESIEFNRPIHSHHFKLNELVDNSLDDELKSIDLTLPDENYYLLSHVAIPSKNILLLTLGKTHSN